MQVFTIPCKNYGIGSSRECSIFKDLAVNKQITDKTQNIFSLTAETFDFMNYYLTKLYSIILIDSTIFYKPRWGKYGITQNWESS